MSCQVVGSPTAFVGSPIPSYPRESLRVAGTATAPCPQNYSFYSSCQILWPCDVDSRWISSFFIFSYSSFSRRSQKMSCTSNVYSGSSWDIYSKILWYWSWVHLIWTESRSGETKHDLFPVSRHDLWIRPSWRGCCVASGSHFVINYVKGEDTTLKDSGWIKHYVFSMS